MADELSRLGVSWVEESVLRNDVVAKVDAHVDAESAADEAELRRRWAALDEMERVVAGVQQQVDAAAGVAGAPPGVTVVGRDKTKDEEDGVAVLRFRLARAQREVECRAKLLHRWQLEMEARQQRRVEEAKRRIKVAELANAVEKRAHVPGTAGTSTSNNNDSGGVPGVAVGRLHAAASLGALTHAPSTPAEGRDVARGARYPLRASETPRSAALAVQSGVATELRRRSGSGGVNSSGAVVPLTTVEYAGGTILPSLHRVTLTNSDVRSKSRKYADDGDLEAFRARQEKRKRLEAAAASMAAVQSASSSRGGVKVEEKLDEKKYVVKREEKEAETTGASRMEAIDVDALMEDSDDAAGEEVLQQVFQGGSDRNKKNDKSKRDENDGVMVKQESCERFVTLVPGISLAASIHDRLLPHQHEGVCWLLQLHMQRSGGILGDEMGLGKTIQVASMLNALHHSQKLRGPCLIVSPLTVLRQWVAEMHRWAPYMRTCVMHESSASNMSREDLVASIRGTAAVLLTTYTAVRQHCQLLHTAGFQYVVLDEGHKISNPEATVTLAVKSFPTPHRLILSGTPIQNTLKELWCLFDFVRPGLLSTMNKFVEEFEEPINASKNVRASSLMLATAVECARALQERIAPFLLRRLKRQVMSHALPQKYERVIRCPLSDEQLEAYVELLMSPRVQRLLSNTLSYTQMMGKLNRDGRDASGCLHTAGRRYQLMQQHHNGSVRLEAFRVLNELRQICNHVDMFRLRQVAANGDDIFDDDDDDCVGKDEAGAKRRRPASRPSLRSNRAVNYQGSGKLQTLRKLLTVWQRGGQRVLIFSQTRMVLDIIENMCEQEGFTYIRMDGSTSGHHRQELMDRFNEDDRIVAALLTTRVGGVGVNLIGADRVVLFDPDWNPVTDEQARERAWRIGQTRDVGVYRLIASGTVEEAILRRQLAKMYVTEKVLHNPALQRFFHEQESLTETFYLGAEYDDRVPTGKKHVMVAQELSPLLEEEEEKEEEAVGTVNSVQVKRESGAAVYRVRAPVDAVSPEASSPADGRRAATNKAETALLQDLVDGQEVRVSGADAVARRLARLSASQTMLRVTSTSRTFEQQQEEMRQRLAAGRERDAD
ncbi:putative DNA excision repair protein, putative,SNF2 family helicase-like protein [Trypanosoma grayi]|uniref:putative DNA excision repair protein, putative,SNF2 family helicase-like protein n=1 Tax=Trypanosoma grayi TaxID=71804 RepID=UPI0004F40D69|nr:putative DNA excision repair protein, putative,SNF2 family helicase-like protein [Trypanosoma grayi]KEG09134.1 putative DNA excision repair protein, putative,SNF2 family helicase-like protein [Trypanosoma grayi]